MIKQKRILIAPLDWGLGHASRCIPIIRLLLKYNAEVLIAADSRPAALLKQEFPQLEFIKLKGYKINYPSSGSMAWKMLLSIPKILLGINKEHNALKRIIKEKNIDVVISDNRFGLWNKGIKSIFITHQLMIKTPIAEKLLHTVNLNFISKYNECWIPDVEGSTNLSGDLSHKYILPKNAFFIGVLSRFASPLHPLSKEEGVLRVQYDAIVILSGPEPQRSIFEKIILEQLSKSNLKALVVCGKTEQKQKREINEDIEIVNNLNAEEMKTAILNSSVIIARSGYSTIMDLAILGKKVIFVPTPGQTEQEYLAERFKKMGLAFYQTQSEFDLQHALLEADNYNGFEAIKASDELEKRIAVLFD